MKHTEKKAGGGHTASLALAPVRRSEIPLPKLQRQAEQRKEKRYLKKQYLGTS